MNYLYALILVCNCCICFGHYGDHFIFNVISEKEQDGMIALNNTLLAASMFRKFDLSYWKHIKKTIYASKDVCRALPNHIRHLIQSKYELGLHCHNIEKYKNSRISFNKNPMQIEYVNDILYALDAVINRFHHGVESGSKRESPRVLVMSYSSLSGVFPTDNFLNKWISRVGALPGTKNYYDAHELSSNPAIESKETNNQIEDKNLFDILLLGKNKRLTSVSDWHDLQLMAFRITNKNYNLLKSWFRVLRTEFDLYGRRDGFNMIEPRPALIEANIQHEEPLDIRYWSRAHVRVVSNKDTPIDLSAAIPDYMLEIHCGVTRETSILEERDISNCINAHEPFEWRNVKGKVDKMDEFTFRESNGDGSVPHGADTGTLRYMLADKASNKPPKYCFETTQRQFKKDSPPYDELNDLRTEKPPSSLIWTNAKDSHFFYNGTKEKFKYSRARQEHNATVLLITGTSLNPNEIGKKMYMFLHKYYFAFRHGYKFAIPFSSQFSAYYSKWLFEEVVGHTTYFYGVMSKPLMVLDAMFNHHTTHEWIFFTDDDVHFNAEWLYLSLDTFLKDVPPEKLFVHTNYRSIMSGAFFVRNSIEGRRLVRDWLSVVMSGYVTCHGFDQAALEILMVMRQFPHIPYKPNPFNFSCLDEVFGGHGCNRFDMSCDYKFEKMMMQFGFVGDVKSFWNHLHSSYSMGCANDQVLDFHVLTETSARPRLQCFHCAWVDDLLTPVWDGPIGGGNQKVLSGAIDGWFSNHKAAWQFHEQYLQSDSCVPLAFLEQCSADEIGDLDDDYGVELGTESKLEKSIIFTYTMEDEMLLEQALYEYKRNGGGRQKKSKEILAPYLLSLYDGYAINMITNQMCIVDIPIEELQRQITMMSEYKDMIKKSHESFTMDSWMRYFHYNVTVHQVKESKCTESEIESGVGCRDGIPSRVKDGNWFLYPKNHCEVLCERNTDNELWNTGLTQHREYVGCRDTDDVQDFK